MYNRQPIDYKFPFLQRMTEVIRSGSLNNIESIEFEKRCLHKVREIGDRNREIVCLGSLGNAYHSLGEYHLAIEFYQQWLNITRKIGDWTGECIGFGDYQLPKYIHENPLLKHPLNTRRLHQEDGYLLNTATEFLSSKENTENASF